MESTRDIANLLKKIRICPEVSVRFQNPLSAEITLHKAL
jgi:hypothetical protein